MLVSCFVAARTFRGKMVANVSLCTEADINLLKNDEYWDPHAIAGLLKLYLRELPNSLLTRELQQRFLGVVGTYFHLQFF